MVKLGTNFLKADEVKNDDVIEFLNEGEWQENTKYKYPDGNPKQDFIIKVKIHETEKNLRLNKANRDILVKSFGNETSKWVGKKAFVNVEFLLVQGEKKKAIMLSPLVNESVTGWDDGKK